MGPLKRCLCRIRTAEESAGAYDERRGSSLAGRWQQMGWLWCHLEAP